MAKRSKKQTKKKTEPLLGVAVQLEFAVFLQQYPPKQFSRNLRDILIDYLSCKNDYGRMDDERTIIMGVWRLFEVLDKAEDEWKKRDIDELYKLADEQNEQYGQ